MKKPTSKSTLSTHPELTRAAYSCRVGRDSIERNIDPPEGVSHSDYAMFCLLHAVEDIALAMMKGKP